MILTLKLHKILYILSKLDSFSLELQNEVLRNRKVENWWIFCDLKKVFKGIKGFCSGAPNLMLNTKCSLGKVKSGQHDWSITCHWTKEETL